MFTVLVLCPATKSLGMFRSVRQDHHLPHHFWGCKIVFRIILMYHKPTFRSFWDDLPVFLIWTMKWRWLYSSSEVFKHVIYLSTWTNVAKLSSTAKQNDGWLGWGSELIRKVQLTKLRPNDHQKWASPSDLTQSDVILSYFVMFCSPSNHWKSATQQNAWSPNQIAQRWGFSAAADAIFRAGRPSWGFSGWKEHASSCIQIYVYIYHILSYFNIITCS